MLFCYYKCYEAYIIVLGINKLENMGVICSRGAEALIISSPPSPPTPTLQHHNQKCPAH